MNFDYVCARLIFPFFGQKIIFFHFYIHGIFIKPMSLSSSKESALRVYNFILTIITYNQMNKKFTLHEAPVQQSQVLPYNRSSTQTKRPFSSAKSKHKRIPIFTPTSTSTSTHNNHNNSYSYNNNRSTKLRSTFTTYRDRPAFELEQLSERKVINYDFCGCENKMSTCQIVTNNFLTDVSVGDMRNSYAQECERNVKKDELRDSRYRMLLLSGLPRWYPQLLYSQLKNLLQLMPSPLTIPQFQCLSAIEYHSKADYTTYFLYKDLKSCYNNKEQFYQLAERELGKLATSFKRLRYEFNETTSLAVELEEFINNYYDSIGANLVPIQCYAKFLAAIYVVGSRVFVRMLTNFLVLRREELKRGLKFLRANQRDLYRNYMREFNFQDFILQAQ